MKPGPSNGTPSVRGLTLLPITAASLITMMAETLPAGLLPQLSQGVHASTSVTGQAVSVYALGSMLAALPLVALTRSRPQRPVLVAAIAVVGDATLAAAASGNVAVLLLARVAAGMAAGLLWALAAHYAMAISPEGAQAKALSIAMLGVPLGMAIGTPLGAFAGQHLGWRVLMSALGIAGLATAGWARGIWGRRRSRRRKLPRVMRWTAATAWASVKSSRSSW